MVNTGSKHRYFDEFLSTPSCTDINFYYEVFLSSGANLPSFIYFYRGSNRITINTNSVSNIGTYEIRVNGYAND